tara:strand:+ start:1155 stop:2195 length:1041 start_codon:yes stop_codon:yes gene_type:complete
MVKPLFATTFVLILFGGVLYFYQEYNNLTNSKNSNSFGQKLLEELDTKALNKIHIRSADSFVSLIQLQGGGWNEQSLKYEADFSSIQELLLKISQIKLGDLVTNNSDHHKRFKLLEPPDNIEKWEKDVHANSITLFKGDGAIMLSLLLGKNRQNGEGQFIRHNGSNKVFLIPEKLYVDTSLNDWLDKQLLELETNKVKSIKIITNDNQKINISRKSFENKWISNEETSIPNEKQIQNFLEKIENLSFTKLLDRDFINENKLSKTENTLFVTLFDGKLFTLKFLSNDESRENYILSLRMGILQDASNKKIIEKSKITQEMESFNKKMSGRFFEISSWEGKELLMSND